MKQNKWEDIKIDSLQEHNAESHKITIESIQQAFLELLKTKELKAITVKNIVDRAGVSRSAFYRNYQSKEEVLQSIVFHQYKQVMEKIRNYPSRISEEWWIKLVEDIINEYVLIYEMTSADVLHSEVLLQCMNMYFRDFMMPLFPNQNKIQMQFWLGGFHNAILCWLDEGQQESAHKLAYKILNCMFPGSYKRE